MYTIEDHAASGYQAARRIRGFYPRGRRAETLFDCRLAKWGQLSSSVSSLVGLAENVKKLSKNSDQMFNDLLVETMAVSDRIGLVAQTMDWSQHELATLRRALSAGFRFGIRPCPSDFKFETDHGLFTPETMPPGFAEQYSRCKGIPPLDILDDDPLNVIDEDNGVSCLQSYSDPYGIYKDWLKDAQRKLELKARARARAKARARAQAEAEAQAKRTSSQLTHSADSDAENTTAPPLPPTPTPTPANDSIGAAEDMDSGAGAGVGELLVTPSSPRPTIRTVLERATKRAFIPSAKSIFDQIRARGLQPRAHVNVNDVEETEKDSTSSQVPIDVGEILQQQLLQASVDEVDDDD